MKINLKNGIGDLLFGMREENVIAIYGEPDRTYKDDEDNVIYLYNDKKMRLTFYSDEDFRLGYIISSNPNLELFSHKVVGQKWPEVKEMLKNNKINSLEHEPFDTTDNYFNEDNWIIFQVEYDEVTTIEVGAVIVNDDFEWKFKG